MNYNEYLRKYQRFLEKWKSVRTRNESGDYSCGAAIYGPSCDKVVAFDNDAQKQNYAKTYCPF